LLAEGPLVVTFYRGVWCPYCNLELEALDCIRAEINTRGASLIAISQQTVASNRKCRQCNRISFPILSDQRGELAKAFGIRWTVPPELREVYKELGSDLTLFNGDDSWTLPMPARYVIDRDGVIAYSEINPDYTHRPEPSSILPVLNELHRV
jgi:peroxiredoxin